MPHVDAVIIGSGWTRAIMAKELTEAGLNVVALERGEYRDTYPDGAYPKPLPFQHAAGIDQQTLRGAYLVQGLGHCGACHTARGIGSQEKALSDQGNNVYLAGGSAIEGWIPPSLHNEHGGGLAPWSEADIAEFLKTGRNSHSASFGGMNDVVSHSTQHMNDADFSSIAKYLKSLPTANSAPPFVPDDKVAKALYSGIVDTHGAQIYLDRCASCHRSRRQRQGFPSLGR